MGDFRWVGSNGQSLAVSDMKTPRPMRPEWAENIRRVCERDRAVFFFKQNAEKAESEPVETR